MYSNEFNEVLSSMRLVIKWKGISEYQRVFHVGNEAQTYEVVVPEAIIRNHKEPYTGMAQQDLTLLIKPLLKSLWLWILQIQICLSPLEPSWTKIVGSQETRARCKRKSYNNRFLCVPGFVVHEKS